MNNKIYLLLVFFFGVLGMNAQSDYYYYYNGNKIPITLDKTSVTLSLLNGFEKKSIADLNLKDFVIQTENTTGKAKKFAAVEFKNLLTDSDYSRALNSLNSSPNIIKAQPNFITEKGIKIGMSDYLYVKLKTSGDLKLLQKLASERNVEIVEQNRFMPLWYTLICTKKTIGNTLEVANEFFETGYFASSSPDLLSDDVMCTNDPSFGSLWGLYNSANPNIDINACQAWGITQGAGVNVAVLDQGIFKTHIDLSSNIHPLSYNTETNTPLSQLFGTHGTHCAGTIAAIKDNNTQVVGVSPSSKLMDVSNSLASTPNSRIKRADGINWAWQNGAHIISNSWGSAVQYTVIDDAIQNALTLGRGGRGTIVVFATGNDNSGVGYPANINPDIFAIGSITSGGSRSSFSNFGTQLDVVAPGSDILSTYPNNATATISGTSMATPHVAGVCALVLSVNPCLTAKQVRDIIEMTSQKVGGYAYATTPGKPNGTWHTQMGYGLVDAYAAVQMAQQLYSPTVDLLVKDTPADNGIEPNIVSPYMWASEDIWIRNNADNGLVHQNPEYSPTVPNHVYVRVKNKSCVASLGNEQLKLYWSKAGTSLAWPNNWNGTYFVNTVLMGAQVGTVTIPALQPNQETILHFTWFVPNPANYAAINPEPWHFCMLARVEAASDPMTFAETTDLNLNVKNNNNIAWKNITIVDAVANRPIGGVIGIGNPTRAPRKYFVEFIAERGTGRPIFEQAEVTIKMDNALYERWLRGGGEARGLENGRLRGDKVVRADYAILNNIPFEANELATLNLTFNFLTEDIDQETFTYHVVQRDALTGEVVGGETYTVNRAKRGREAARAIADAGATKVVDKNDVITISAAQINEAAIYNWYDASGNLVFQGKDMTVSVDMAKKYKLEVIALSDGFKDYAEVEVKLKPSSLGVIAPNPAKNKVGITYKLNDAKSAYLMIIGSYGTKGSSNNYILDLNSDQTLIDISSYREGFYTIALVCDGKIVDAKTLVKK